MLSWVGGIRGVSIAHVKSRGRRRSKVGLPTAERITPIGQAYLRRCSRDAPFQPICAGLIQCKPFLVIGISGGPWQNPKPLQTLLLLLSLFSRLSTKWSHQWWRCQMMNQPPRNGRKKSSDRWIPIMMVNEETERLRHKLIGKSRAFKQEGRKAD